MNQLVNQVQLIGHVGQEPEMISFDTGTHLVKLRVATNESYRLKDGTYNQVTQWHTVSAWGKLAEQMAQDLTKGQKVMIKGKLENRAWEDKQGNRRHTTQIKAVFFAPIGDQKKPSQAPALPF